MSVAVRNIGAPLRHALAPGREIDLLNLAELDIDAPLADSAAADAGEIGLAAGLEWEATVHEVIPAVPLRHTRGVHGADEIAQPLRRRDADFLSADAVHLRDGHVRQ